MNCMTQTHVRTLVDGKLGRLRLDRPAAINALTLEMVRAMTDALVEWRTDPAIELVMIDHAEGRGFCAGGDVVTIAKSSAGHGAAAQAFFFQEYRMNHLMYSYPKPGVVFMDGITMGGGVGISCPCRYRVATERTVFSMPETTIGLFPDVGGGRYLSRLRGRVAQYLALTSARLTGADCLALRLATHYILSDRLEDVKQQLADAPDRIEAILAEASVEPPAAPILDIVDDIDRLFASDRLEEILAALAADGSDWAKKQHATIVGRSPTACKVSLRLLVESPQCANFEEEMRLEFGIMMRMFRHQDFLAGVTALLIEKTGNPQWQPPTAEAVTDEMVDAFFQPLPARQRWEPLELDVVER